MAELVAISPLLGTMLEVWVRPMGCEGHRLTMRDVTGKKVKLKMVYLER